MVEAELVRASCKTSRQGSPPRLVEEWRIADASFTITYEMQRKVTSFECRGDSMPDLNGVSAKVGWPNLSNWELLSRTTTHGALTIRKARHGVVPAARQIRLILDTGEEWHLSCDKVGWVVLRSADRSTIARVHSLAVVYNLESRFMRTADYLSAVDRVVLASTIGSGLFWRVAFGGHPLFFPCDLGLAHGDVPPVEYETPGTGSTNCQRRPARRGRRSCDPHPRQPAPLPTRTHPNVTIPRRPSPVSARR